MIDFLSWGGALLVGGIALFVLYLVIKSRYKKAGPDEALIVYGRRKLFGRGKVVSRADEAEGYRIVRGAGTFIWPGWEAFERLFQAQVLRMLLAKGLIGQETVRNLLAWRHSGFSVRAAVRVEHREAAVRLGRTMIHSPIVLERLSWSEHSGEVAYKGRPSRRAGPHDGVARWEVLEFIARVVDHIPQPAQQRVRTWGFYANAAWGKRRRQAEQGNAAGLEARGPRARAPGPLAARRARAPRSDGLTTAPPSAATGALGVRPARRPAQRRRRSGLSCPSRRLLGSCCTQQMARIR